MRELYQNIRECIQVASSEICSYLATLVYERPLEILVGIVIGAIWRWYIGKTLKEDFQNQLDEQREQNKRDKVELINRFDNNRSDKENVINDAIDTDTADSLHLTMRELVQTPMGNGRTCAKLPDGTYIISMEDKTYRLALPLGVEGLPFKNVQGKMPNAEQ